MDGIYGIEQEKTDFGNRNTFYHRVTRRKYRRFKEILLLFLTSMVDLLSRGWLLTDYSG